MTHEQKPESAEFRTREAQASVLMQVICDAGWRPSDAFECAMREITEAEARGAAEQRRKEESEFEKILAERDDAEDFIRKIAEAVLGEVVEWSNGYDFQSALNEVSERIYLLEKKAANVAALEARVKEVEGEVARLKKPEFYAVSDLEDSWLSTEELMDSLDGDIPHFETVEIDCFRRVSRIWAFYDGKEVREFADKKEAEFAAAAAIREGGE